MIFAKDGQIVDTGTGNPLPASYGDGWVEMQGAQPSADHIPQADGTWLLPDEARVFANITNGKQLRWQAEQAPLEALGSLWAVEDKDRQKINEIILEGERSGYPPETQVGWVLADDTVRMVTVADLKAVLQAFHARQQTLFTQYGQWLMGDKLTPFSL